MFRLQTVDQISDKPNHRLHGLNRVFILHILHSHRTSTYGLNSYYPCVFFFVSVTYNAWELHPTFSILAFGIYCIIDAYIFSLTYNIVFLRRIPPLCKYCSKGWLRISNCYLIRYPASYQSFLIHLPLVMYVRDYKPQLLFMSYFNSNCCHPLKK
jgi:hypothetical protein